MKTTVFLRESIYDCKLIITDSHGEREYYISALTAEGPNTASVTAEPCFGKTRRSVPGSVPESI